MLKIILFVVLCDFVGTTFLFGLHFINIFKAAYKAETNYCKTQYKPLNFLQKVSIVKNTKYLLPSITCFALTAISFSLVVNIVSSEQWYYLATMWIVISLSFDTFLNINNVFGKNINSYDKMNVEFNKLFEQYKDKKKSYDYLGTIFEIEKEKLQKVIALRKVRNNKFVSDHYASAILDLQMEISAYKNDLQKI